MPRFLRYTLLVLLLLAGVLASLIYSLTWRPEAKEVLALSCPTTAPVLIQGQSLKVMTWNVQYLAGKRYVFWYNLADGSGAHGSHPGAQRPGRFRRSNDPDRLRTNAGYGTG